MKFDGVITNDLVTTDTTPVLFLSKPFGIPVNDSNQIVTGTQVEKKGYVFFVHNQKSDRIEILETSLIMRNAIAAYKQRYENFETFEILLFRDDEDDRLRTTSGKGYRKSSFSEEEMLCIREEEIDWCANYMANIGHKMKDIG